MNNVFLISDTHFGHTNICKFTRENGTKLRPWEDAAEMDERMITLWNEVVKPTDKVYHLGDVVIARRMLAAVMPRLNGDKVLIKGNHDIFKLADYTPYFRDIRAYHKLDRAILSHVPIHPEQLGRFKGNIHGHLHDRVVLSQYVMGPGGEHHAVPDQRYVSVCVEQPWMDYQPQELSVILSRF